MEMVHQPYSNFNNYNNYNNYNGYGNFNHQNGECIAFTVVLLIEVVKSWFR